MLREEEAVAVRALPLFVGMLLFMIVSVAEPLASSAMNLVMCLAGGLIFGAALCAADGPALSHMAPA